MSTNNKVVKFPKDRSVRQSVAWFCRLGTSGHKKLATLQAANELPLDRVVVDASMWPYQNQLAKSLQRDGAEVVLDTKAAELASPSRSKGSNAKAPWANINNGAPLGPNLYRKKHASDLIGAIARFSVEADVDTVLAPGHYLGDKDFTDWLSVDVEACEYLRRCLDKEGGRHIAIDYNLILPHTTVRDAAVRGEIMASLADLPIDNLWVRAGAFGHDATAAGTRHYIEGLRSLHNLGRPIVADYLGGQTSLALLAFGAASGVAHGIGERNRFATNSWEKPYAQKKEGGTFGRAKRVSVPGLDKSLTIPEINLLASARHGRRLIGCEDRECCAQGLSEMLKHPLKHTIKQTNIELSNLQAIPDDHRATHFVDKMLAKSARLTTRVASLQPNENKAAEFGVDSAKLMKSLKKHGETLDRRLHVLEQLAESTDTATHRSAPVIVRAGKLGDDLSSRSGEQ